MPQASNLNFGPRTVIPNLVTVTLGQGGAVVIYNAAGSVNVLADVEGYFEPEPPLTSPVSSIRSHRCGSATRGTTRGRPSAAPREPWAIPR